MKEENKNIAVIEQGDELPIEVVVAQAAKIQMLMKSCMKPDMHFGTIPGTDSAKNGMRIKPKQMMPAPWWMA